jgi:hypothetical protein
MQHFGVCLLSLAALAAPAARAQDRSAASWAQLVPSDARFACYFDLQALFDFAGRDLVQAAIARKAGEDGPVRLRRDWNERMAKEWGLDPLRDLQGFLLYGTALQREEPNAVLLASENVDRFLDKLREMGALDREERDDIAVDRIAPDKVLRAFGVEDADVEGEGYIHVHKLRGEGPARAITFGSSLRQLMPRVQALRERGERNATLSLDPRPGCIAYLEVADALRDLLGETPASRISHKTKHFSMQLSAASGDIAFLAALTTESGKDARQIAAVVNGLKALATMVESEDVPEEVMAALSDAHAAADGTRVTLEFKLARSVLDRARKMIRTEMNDDDDAPPPGTRTRRTIR